MRYSCRKRPPTPVERFNCSIVLDVVLVRESSWNRSRLAASERAVARTSVVLVRTSSWYRPGPVILVHLTPSSVSLSRALFRELFTTSVTDPKHETLVEGGSHVKPGKAPNESPICTYESENEKNRLIAGAIDSSDCL